MLTPIFDPYFSEHSYGFRPGRSCHQAVKAEREHVATGYRYVVDMDLEKFFDCVNHDVLMARGQRDQGQETASTNPQVTQQRSDDRGSGGSPQGGPLSPLLSNILLDDLDKELESRTFLGYTMTANREPKLKVSPKAVERAKKRIREIMRQGRGRKLTNVIGEVTQLMRGWVNNFRLSQVKAAFEELDGWIRRKLRCILWVQWKKPKTRAEKLMRLGIDKVRALTSAYNGRGSWWNAGASHMNAAIPTNWLSRQRLISLLAEHRRFERLI